MHLGEMSHRVFVVEAVAGVGPWGHNTSFPLCLLYLRFWGSFRVQRLGSTYGLGDGRGRSSWARFGQRWAGGEGFARSQPPEVQQENQVELHVYTV